MKKSAELRPSKKYAVGTVHETISGKFEIIERYLGEDGFAWLKYKYLESGEIEDNKEVNVASNIAKLRRKKEFEKLAEKDAPSPSELKDQLKDIQDSLKLLAIQQATILQKLEKLESKYE